MDLNSIQEALQESQLDGWLFYDFHSRDQIAARVLKIDSRLRSRRWYYYIPATGEPKKLVHAIEPWSLDHLPGQKFIYLPWQQQHELLKNILSASKKVAMQYSPMNAIPYVSVVDGGTIELVRSFGIEVVSSADLVSKFESHLTDEDIQSHIEAGKILQMVKDSAFTEIAKRIKEGQNPTEFEIQCYMKELMELNGLFWEDGPIVAINEHAADPHFEPNKENSFFMKEGDLVLFDLWAKLNKPGSIYYDITWMGFIGNQVPDRLEQIFQIVINARDTGLNLVKERFANKQTLYGWEIDDAVRKIISDAGYAKNFIHRTGHNIGEEVHGNGAHIDNLETKDERKIIPGSCFSIEPGIYIPDEKIGFRSEIDVIINNDLTVSVAGDIQKKIIPILTLV